MLTKKVLVVDDSAIVRKLLSQMLTKWGYEPVVCRDGEDAWQALHGEGAPALAIVDWEMPRLNGPGLCRRLRAEAREPYVYVILLTAKEEKEAVVHGLEAGADDYVQKPFDEQELEVRLRAGKRVVELQTQLMEAREAMRALAEHDSLTGLWNRGAIVGALRREFERSQRDGTELTVLMVDLDHFKTVNDTCGHLTGDSVLREAARRLATHIRPYDLAGRYGGEEFLVLLLGCGREAAQERAAEICRAIGGQPVELGDEAIVQTASVGCAVLEPGAPGKAEDLLKIADQALYRAKNGGRNRVEVI